VAEGAIDFWFTMGSTYSYLSVMRLADVERTTGIKFQWRPFHLLIILQEMKHVPFADKPAKCRYMWRDIERRAALHGLPGKLPAPYPATQSVVANLVAIVGMREGWGADFVRAAIGTGSSREKRRGASRICPPVSVISDRIRYACLRSRPLPRLTIACWPKRTPPGGSESSARPPSPSARNCFGAMTASTTRLAGTGTAHCDSDNRGSYPAEASPMCCGPLRSSSAISRSCSGLSRE